MIKEDNLQTGMYEGITAWAQDDTNWKAFSCEGESISSKNIPPMPLRSPKK